MGAIMKLREALSGGKVCIGASITFADPLVSDALADSVDFLWIDLEHVAMSAEALCGHLLAARARNVPAVVRPPGSDTPFIKPILVSGAEGIVVPQVRTAEEVKRIVGDCRYPPIGRRGYGPRVPSDYGRNDTAECVRKGNEELFVAVQVENADAVQNLDEILAVPGLDSIVLGPSDLSASMGLIGQLEHPRVVATIEEIIAKVRAAGLFVGAGLGPDPEYACVLAGRGVQWLQVGCDFGYLVNHMDWIVSEARKRMG